jgi:hypothetical protein
MIAIENNIKYNNMQRLHTECRVDLCRSVILDKISMMNSLNYLICDCVNITRNALINALRNTTGNKLNDQIG